MSSVRMQQFVSELKSKNLKTRKQAARDLVQYVNTEFREISVEEQVVFNNNFNQKIIEMISSSDSDEKIGGILAILCLISTDVGNKNNRISRFAGYLRNLRPSFDSVVMELAAKTVGKLASSSGTHADQYVEFEVKRAFEWLSDERNGPKKYAAVLILREIATMVPTLFFQHATQFFDFVLNVAHDPKPIIRHGAVEALRAAFVVTAQRETSKQAPKPQSFKQCYDEVMNVVSINKENGADDKVHGSLLVLNELFRISNNDWESQYDALMQRLQWDQNQTNAEILSSIPQTKSILKELVSGSRRSDGDSVKIASLGIQYESNACKNLLNENYDQVCSAVISNESSKNRLVNSALMKLLPRLAAFNKSIFVQKYLDPSMSFLLSSSRGRDSEQLTNLFVAVGLVAIALEEHTKPYLAKIFNAIQNSLKDSLKNKNGSPEPAVYVCVTLLGIAAQHNVTAEIEELLEPMLAMGLSSQLVIALRELAIAVPALKRNITKKLMIMLCRVLKGYETSLHMPLTVCSTFSLSAKQSLSIEPQHFSKVILALRTLGNINIEGYSLLPILRHCADHYLSCELQDVRIESIKTCSHLMRLEIEIESDHRKTFYCIKNTVLTIVKQMLVIGVSDNDLDVRYAVFENLDCSFDSYLAEAENIDILIMATNDVNFEIREMSICIIGRLSTVNPDYAIPCLRKVLKRCLTEIKYSEMGRNKQQSARIIDHIAVHAPHFIRPYMQQVLKIFVPKLREPNLDLSILIRLLTCIGNLVQVDGDEMHCWINELFLFLLDMLGDSGSQEKRGVALWVVGKLVEELGYVIQPYEKYPTLLDTLLEFLKNEQHPLIRRETIRVLGLLGALDPYKHKINLGQIDSQIDCTVLLPMTDSHSISEPEWKTSEILVKMSKSSLKDYYPTVAIATLVHIMRDPNLSQYYTLVVQAITSIFQSLGIECVPYLSQVVPIFLKVFRTADINFREFLIQQLVIYINLVGHYVQNYLDDIFMLIKETWTPNSPLEFTLIQLVEIIVVEVGSHFKTYLSQLMPNILRILYEDSSKSRNLTIRMLVALRKFGLHLDEYLNMLIPPLVYLFDATKHPVPVSLAAMETVIQLAHFSNLTEFASCIIHGLMNSIENNLELRETSMETLCVLICQLGQKYKIFTPLISCKLNKCQYNYPPYDTLITQLSNTSQNLEENLLVYINENFKSQKEIEVHGVHKSALIIKKLHTSLPNLQRAWSINRCVSKDDWLEWLRRLGINLLKESPSPALRSCLILAQAYSHFPKYLFNAAFVSCWAALTEPLREELIQILKQALMISDLPEMTQTILNLAEFMDHCENGPLPIDTHILCERSMDCRAYAKVLHYKEEEFIKKNKKKQVSPNVFESLIYINNKLQQKEAVSGLLEVVASKRVENQEPIEQYKIQARWYEKVHDWEQALSLYNENLQKDPHNVEWSLGKMRCLKSLGQWDLLNVVAASNWPHFSKSERVKMSSFAAAAAWIHKEWYQMTDYVEYIPKDTLDGAFYRAVLSIHKEQFEQSHKYIDLAREILDPELTAMAAESYQRAYGAMVSVQILTELEEVIQYKLKPEKRLIIHNIWSNRLQGCQRVVEDWQRIIQVHSLVLKPEEDMCTWLKYAALCRKSSHLVLSHKTLTTLLGTDPSNKPSEPLPMTHPQVTFAYIKYLWTSGAKFEAYDHLNILVDNVLPQLNLKEDDTNMLKHDSIKKLLARCYLKLGCWQEELEELSYLSISNILKHYFNATAHDPKWYKAWYSWAYMNFKTLLLYKNQHNKLLRNEQTTENGTAINTSFDSIQYILESYAVAAVEGFFQSISLSCGKRILQDTLRLLTLWFDYGHRHGVYDAIVNGLKSCPINTWLQVIPQLIARIDTPHTQVSLLVQQLLIDISHHHPHALVYPLIVASKSASIPRKKAAQKILITMRKHNQKLVDEAVMFGDELQKVAILWSDMWFDALEEASILFFVEKNYKVMLEILEPLHAMIKNGPRTHNENLFYKLYSRDLAKASEHCNQYLTSNNTVDLEQAWKMYYKVFCRLTTQLSELVNLELKQVSPLLHSLRNLELTVPGSYVPNRPLIKISFIRSSIQVINSKQRPRKLCIQGSDGKDYTFLLKANEDLRQDERVMQLFGLINTLLNNDPETFRQNLNIRRYAVIPLSPKSGLIGWVPFCDTLQTLIRDYREKKNISLNLEQKIMLDIAPNYDHLTLMRKIEVFEHIIANTQCNDIQELLWQKSSTSEVWLDRRTNYTRSLAVMSMVGYILGLGDRHPSNMMLDRVSGKILHIDFGDCFEAAMIRDEFPEKFPFRLTRMLINAMEITGIEGTFRKTCESVMAVLRNNKDTLMTVLEAFVYDPLLSWRLMESNASARTVPANTTGAAKTETNSIIKICAANIATNTASTATSYAASLCRKAASAAVVDPDGNECEPAETLNKKALEIITRISEKLNGNDFTHEKYLTVPNQVNLLIQQATSVENLCQCYIGWCPFW